MLKYYKNFVKATNFQTQNQQCNSNAYLMIQEKNIQKTKMSIELMRFCVQFATSIAINFG